MANKQKTSYQGKTSPAQSPTRTERPASPAQKQNPTRKP